MPVSQSFTKTPYSIVGDSFISKATDLSIQRTKNMIAVPSPNSLTDTAALYSMPGLKLWSTGTAGQYDRGIHIRLFKGKAYKVSGTGLYSFDSAGVQTLVGSIGGGDLVSMEDNGTVLVIVAGGTAYEYDGTTLSTLTLSFSPVQIAFLNSKFIMLASDQLVYVANVGATTFDPVNSFKAESLPDELIGIKVFNQLLFNFGSETVEPWEDVGAGNPPLARANGAIIESVGLANKDAVCETSDALYFLGYDKIPYRVVNFQAQKLTTQNPGIAELFAGYNKDTASLECVDIYGQYTIIFQFPTDKKVWAFVQETNLWHELDHGLHSELWKGKTARRLFDKTLVGDRENGDIYELDTETYQNDSVAMVRERVFRPMAGETVGSIRALIQMKMIQFAVETGVGVSDSNPQMMVSYSTDGGRSFGNERWLSLGEEGDYQELIEDYSNAKFKDLAVKIRYTGNTRFSLYDAAIYLRESGK